MLSVSERLMIERNSDISCADVFGFVRRHVVLITTGVFFVGEMLLGLFVDKFAVNCYEQAFNS